VAQGRCSHVPIWGPDLEQGWQQVRSSPRLKLKSPDLQPVQPAPAEQRSGQVEQQVQGAERHAARTWGTQHHRPVAECGTDDKFGQQSS
jgi:hypothetical protein